MGWGSLSRPFRFKVSPNGPRKDCLSLSLLLCAPLGSPRVQHSGGVVDRLQVRQANFTDLERILETGLSRRVKSDMSDFICGPPFE